jgi:hypothetical protein
MFTWQAGSGIYLSEFNYHHKRVISIASQEFLCQDISHESINVSDEGITANGVSIKQILRDMKLEYCIMGKKEVYIE